MLDYHFLENRHDASFKIIIIIIIKPANRFMFLFQSCFLVILSNKTHIVHGGGGGLLICNAYKILYPLNNFELLKVSEDMK